MRRSGILLHPTSLPGRYGIGDLGGWAYRFIDFLADSGQRLWQVLPLGPPGYGNSPYQCYSSMAGNPMLVSLQPMEEEGWLFEEDFSGTPIFPAEYVAFDLVIPFKWKLLRLAARRFAENASPAQRAAFLDFCADKAYWLDHFAVFAALKEANGGVGWTEWKQKSDPSPVEVETQKFVQYQFFRQWSRLRAYCRDRGIEIIGDLPIFVAHDSADVWANPELFDLEEGGRPRTIAGVPPDYFSSTGQCWGTPLYRWDALARSGYRWWINRVHSMLDFVDWTRIDHFRGFEKYYEIPGDAKTAEIGRWVEGPGDAFFAALREVFGRLPFIAEDLGFITPEVHALRDRWGFPGMRVLQFAFGSDDPNDPFKPHNYIPRCVVYTGTHDNDTTHGWFTSQGSGDSTRSPRQAQAERDSARFYLGCDGREIHWSFIRAALGSVAEMAVIPMQDVLGLGSEARMNMPARAENNWIWRLREDQLPGEIAQRLRRLTYVFGRGK